MVGMYLVLLFLSHGTQLLAILALLLNMDDVEVVGGRSAVLTYAWTRQLALSHCGSLSLDSIGKVLPQVKAAAIEAPCLQCGCKCIPSCM